MSQDLIARLRARKTATAWTRGIDTDYPTAWAPDPDCQDAATALEQQAAEIARLSAKNTDLHAENEQSAIELVAMTEHRDEVRQERNRLRTEFSRLTAERDALRVDAERYRYLRNRVPVEVFDARGLKAGAWIDCEDDAGQLTLLTGEDADRDIDAARAAREST